MWVTVLALVLVLGRGTARDEQPNTQLAFEDLELFLDQQKNFFNERFQTLQQKVEESCTPQPEQYTSQNTVSSDFDIKMALLIDEFINKLSTITTRAVQDIDTRINILSSEVLNSLDNKISPLNDRISQLQQTISTLGTHSDLVELKGKLSTLISTTTSDVKSSLSSLATQSHLSNSTHELDTRLTEVKELLTDCCKSSTAENKEILNEVLNKVTLNKESIEGVSTAQRDAFTEWGNHHILTAGNLTSIIHDLQQLIENGNTNLNDLAGKLDGVAADLSGRLTTLEVTVKEIKNNTEIPPTAPPTTTTTTTTTTTLPPTTKGPLVACEDSVFRGSSPNLSVCAAAVRFKKCQLQFVSFHCCHSCTDAGQIPTLGSWRYLNYPREVTILQALNYMRP
ncbi:hypothetical protein OTU49_015421 [Cherax quadricarinatus]|uniref:PLAC domain-containing protein n=1 Tax=Cherax quadricarinatus TaxID=27406 RepID=A0AAW0YBX3_CHEQU|nr:uncharacterized protein LOC128688597 [Cherax quadricarinatus]